MQGLDSKGTVIVLEDDEGTAALIASQIQRLGLTTKTFTDSQDALMFLEKNKETVDVILFILDYQLANGENGLHFYRSARLLGVTSPAILTTGFSEQKIIIEALRSGVRDVVLKTGEFTENLKLTISQVLDDHAREVELRTLRAAKDAQERVRNAFEAAEVMVWSYRMGEDLITCDGRDLVPLLAEMGSDKARQIPIQKLFQRIAPPQRTCLIKAVKKAVRSGSHFECQIRLNHEDRPRWWLIRGEVRSPMLPPEYTASGVAIDVTDKQEALHSLQASLKQISLLNERLAYSVAETHHRVKNSFQIVTSLLSIEARKTGTLSINALKTIQGHVRALASLHDLLTDRAQGGKDVEHVELGALTAQVATILQSLSPRLQTKLTDIEGVVSARSASALMVVVVELVMNASKHSSSLVTLAVSECNEVLSVCVSNDFEKSRTPDSSESKPGALKPGLALVNALLSNDLGSKLKETTDNELHSASFNVKVQKN